MAEEARGFLGSGNIYINRIVGGVKQGRKGPYYVNKIAIKNNVEKKELISKGRDDYGNPLESVLINKPADFTVEMTEVNAESMILQFLGTSEALTQAAGSLTDEPVVIKKGSWVDIGKKNIDPDEPFVVKHVSGTPTYVAGTDYEVDMASGQLKILEGSAIVDGATVEVTADYLVANSTRIRGGTQTELRAEIFFVGKNQAGGLPVELTAWEAVLAADSEFDFVADEFGLVNLTGQMKIPVGKTEPYIVDLGKAA